METVPEMVLVSGPLPAEYLSRSPFRQPFPVTPTLTIPAAMSLPAACAARSPARPGGTETNWVMDFTRTG
jgi:hypothetical protein